MCIAEREQSVGLSVLKVDLAGSAALCSVCASWTGTTRLSFGLPRRLLLYEPVASVSGR